MLIFGPAVTAGIKRARKTKSGDPKPTKRKAAKSRTTRAK